LNKTFKNGATALSGLKDLKGFTLLELLIVLIIVSVMLVITYPLITNFILYPGYGKDFNKTVKILKYLINKRYSENKFPAVFIKFDFKSNMMEIYYKKNLKLIPFKKLKVYKILYKNIRLYKIETKGKTYKKGHIFEEISENYVSPPFELFFNSGKVKKALSLKVDTYAGKIVTH
jgi:prepilin-type N-terminal cleavage/methylation domain-containing protein